MLEELSSVQYPETTEEGLDVLFFAEDIGLLGLTNELVDGEVGGDQYSCACQLGGLVLLVDGEASFVAQCLEEVGGESLHGLVVEVFEHDMGVYSGVVEVEELVVEVLLEVVRVDKSKNSALAASSRAMNPQMRVAIAVELVATLESEGLDLLSILEEGTRELGKRLGVFPLFDHASHLDEDVVNLALLFFIASLGEERWRGFVGRQVAKFQQDGASWIDFAELFSMVSTPAGERERTVPWNEIVAVALFDVPRLEDRELGVDALKDDTDVDMADTVVVVLGFGADLDTPNK